MIISKSTPIFICAKDRVMFLRRLVERLRQQGYNNIIVIDTGSTFPEMLDFLPRVDCGGAGGVAQIHDCPNPHLALWTYGLLKIFNAEGGPFVYTDCDVLPDCPHDWIFRLGELLDRHPEFPKAGLGLRIDDLPDCYARKAEVIEWESKFWARQIEADAYDAPIDTTLALYRPGAVGLSRAIRTGGEYVARHLPWYSDSKNLAPDEAHYKANMAPGVGHWR